MNDRPVKVEDRRRQGLQINPETLLEQLGVEEYFIADDTVYLTPEAFEIVARYFGVKYPKLAVEFRQRGWRWVKEERPDDQT